MPHTAIHVLIHSFTAALLMMPAMPSFAAQSEWSGVARVVALGDVHGDYAAFVAVLRSAGVIDQKDRWIGGKTHLVQTGDVLDRGKDSKKVMDLLMALEKQATKAGGQVHALIGNHEAMNVYGDLRYVTPDEFAAFRTSESESVRNAFWEQESKGVANDAARKKWEAEHPLGWFEHRIQFGPKGTYGKWIRSHNAIVKINDAIYLHGGLSPKYAAVPVARINEMIAAELKDVTKIAEGSPVTAEDGPLWYRSLAQEDGPAIAAHVDQVLAAQGIKRIVIGHTPTAGAVIPRFGGKVIMIDVGLSAYYGSNRANLLREGEGLFAIHRGEKIPLPVDGGDFLGYLKKALALEPAGSALAKYVASVEAAAAGAR